MGRSDKVNFDVTPLAVVLILLLFGLVMVYEASSAQALRDFADKYYFVKEQIKWVVLGLFLAFLTYFFDYRHLKKLALPMLLFTLALLVMVFIPGIGVAAHGANRWIDLRFIVIQPSELAKLTLTVYLCSWLTNREKGKLLPFLFLVGIVVGLIVAQPDMGTAIVVLAVSLIVYFLSDSPILGLLGVLPVVLAGGIALTMKSEYRLRRILTFFDANVDPLGASYHIRQALVGLGSGGLFGLGLGNSRQKYSYLPEATTDSIFAIIGEELGLVGGVVLMGLFLFFVLRAVRQTVSVGDPFGRLLGLSVVFWIAVQTVVNLSSMVALIPLTGVPLPFISYGGSAVVVELIGVGILSSIWRRAK